MADPKKLHPVGVCTTCHGITYRVEAIDQRCGRSPQGRRCRGTFANASRDMDWKECTACSGTGKYDARPCPYCRGIGWSFARERASVRREARSADAARLHAGDLAVDGAAQTGACTLANASRRLRRR